MSVSSTGLLNEQLMLGQPLLPASRTVYKRHELLAMCSHDVTPARSVRKAIFSHGLWLPGYLRLQQKAMWKSPLSSSVAPINGNNQEFSVVFDGCAPFTNTPANDAVDCRLQCDSWRGGKEAVPVNFLAPVLLQAEAQYQSRVSPELELSFALLNIRSALNRYDDIVDLMHNHEVLGLVETWHDVGSPVFSRLRADGFNIIDVPRPRLVDDMSTNHGGVAVIARLTVRLQPVSLVHQPFSTFEHVCVRLTTASDSILLVVVYRPGSVAPSISFVDDISSMIERLVTLGGPVYLVGDFNVRFDRDDDPIADQLQLLFDSAGLSLRPTGPTHLLGGVLDVVVASDPVDVSLVDVGLSDHQLLSWRLPLLRSSPLHATVSSRPWRRLDLAAHCVFAALPT